MWVSTPSFIEMCLLLPNLNEEQYGSLNQFFFCGEILPHRTANALVSRYPNATIYNTYGPTEATVAVTSIQITQDILIITIHYQLVWLDLVLLYQQQMKANLSLKVKV